MFKKKSIFIIIIILLITIISIFLIYSNNKKNKNVKIGKNTSSQEFVDYILNIKSYECIINVDVNSNKNTNKYIIKQSYIKDGEITQEVIEPSNIQGVKLIKKEGKLIIENTALSLTKIIEGYEEIIQNNLDLQSFINDYKDSEKSQFKEEENQIIMETISKKENKYTKYKILYISKETGKPTKMEIKDINQNTLINIIYNEININKQT